MEHLSSAIEQQDQQVEWRRESPRAMQQGYSQREISHILQVGLATVNRDISYLRNQAKANIKRSMEDSRSYRR